MSRRPRAVSIALLATLILPLAACGGSEPLDRPSDTAVDQSALGQQRCVAQGDEQRLFVVDWDATDLAAFESRAGRDLVVVKYDACRVTMLHGCSDEGVAGRFGAYRKPIATSGGVETLAVKSHDELYAKLPLGAATFGGEVARGRALDLTYFVSGTVDATRDSVYRDDLKEQARCAEATHFVSSYALGAFSLASVDRASAGGSASVAGFGGGGKTSSEAQQLKRAGDMTTCTSLDPHGCRVPVRLTLRPLSDGARPGATAAAPIGVPAGDTTAPAMAMMNAVQLRLSAEQKLMAGDGAGCLADLDRGAATDRSTVDAQTSILRARCEMRAGRCEEGKKHYREAKAAWSRQMDAAGSRTGATDASIAAEADTMARQHCPSAASGGAPPTMSLVMAMSAIQQAAASKDGPACIEKGRALNKAIQANAADPMAKAAAGGLRTAAICAGDAGRCAEARELWGQFSKIFTPGTDADFIESGFRQNVSGCARK